ncbi:glycosyltransferase family 4 protein [Sphingomonas sp.]|uniref:glycosyltransferase family 4 protein n=1 Tax=Sphingomonas sp. TaxID=28214 RepID=UPI001EC34E57|nr:glycosyltransferase family 4 protein [Sphingomonas sp.]MBX3594751.1 glycosyltransferase family 4 protein [Sphingomonas sp.]
MNCERPRLWCVSELYFPEQGTASHLLTQTAEGLAKDYDVHVLCGQPDYFVSGQKAPARESRNGTRIYRVGGTRFGGGLVSRLINALTFTCVILFFALVHFRKGDRILAATNPPPVPLVIGLAAKVRRCRATMLVHDVYPEVLAATGTVDRRSLPYRVLSSLFRASYLMFDTFVVLGEDMKRIVQEKLGNAERPIFVIPNWADDDIQPIDRDANPFRAEHGLEGKFIVQFSGNFGRTHDLQLLVDAARLLADREDIVFLFVGTGAKAGLVDDGATGRSNVVFLPRQPRERLREMLAASDATIISFVDGMLGLSVPSRMYNVMAAGVPIIASAHPASELVREITAANSGWVLDRPDPENLADLVRSLASRDGLAEAQQRGQNARTAVLDRYLAHHAIELYSRAMR